MSSCTYCEIHFADYTTLWSERNCDNLAAMFDVKTFLVTFYTQKPLSQSMSLLNYFIAAWKRKNGGDEEIHLIFWWQCWWRASESCSNEVEKDAKDVDLARGIRHTWISSRQVWGVEFLHHDPGALCVRNHFQINRWSRQRWNGIWLRIIRIINSNKKRTSRTWWWTALEYVIR